MKNYARLSLNQLELSLSLGVTPAERSQAQIVVINIDIDFPKPPHGCLTDQLNDTYCYDSLIKKIAEQITPKSFCLIEHLAHEIYQLVKLSFSESFLVQVSVTKKPMLTTKLTIANACFCYGDR